MEPMTEESNITKIFSKKGQTLTELAIFGSILLFCVAMLIQYGLEANYAQQVQMEAFRKAQKLAFYKSGPAANASLIMVKDKPLPDARDQWGFAERHPNVAGGNVTWDTNLSSQYVKRYADAPDVRDLPALYFEVDKANPPGEAMAPVPPGAGENRVFGFYTARFEKASCPGTITVLFEDPEHKKSGEEYYEVNVSCGEIKIMRMEGGWGEEKVEKSSELLMYPYFRYNGLKRKITWADVDKNDNGKLEFIIAANKDKELFYIDYHSIARTNVTTVAGAIQIDGDNTTVYPWDDRGFAEPTDKQGLIGDSEKKIEQKSKIVKSENRGRVTSRTELNAKQTLTHKIRLNEGQVVDIPAEFPANKGNLYNW